MRSTLGFTLAAMVGWLELTAAAGSSTPFRAGASRAQPVRWDSLPAAIQRRLTASGVDARSFPVFCRNHEQRTLERVRESDLDALIYYALQSTSFTSDPPIEPALSAKASVEAGGGVPEPAERRLRALVPALRTPPPASRLAYFRGVLDRETSDASQLDAFLRQEYTRATRFLYAKEFVAPREPDSAAAVAALYRSRGLSTDTAVEAGYLVHVGLATLQALEPTRRIRRVLIIGPGLDLAPRTGLVEAGPPESYQPYAVVDSLVGLGLSRSDDLTVVGADVNPRVVGHLEAATNREVSLALVTSVGDSETVTLEEDYRRYFTTLGGSIGDATAAPTLPDRYRGHLRKSVRIRREVSRVIEALRLDAVTERVDGGAFDLVVATNVFPYLDDVPLALALANIAAVLTPGGVLLHNEARPLVGDVTADLGLPLEHARTATIARVRAGTPLYDRVFMHVKTRAGRAGLR
ncbi:MAG: hypothetical protein ACRD09_05475 [Vicinamibacterales bacterium]